MLIQSAGCCDGSGPLCLCDGDLLVGPGDLLLGEIDGVPFYVDHELYERWNRPPFELDLAPGRSDLFSLEAADGVRFLGRTPSRSSAHLIRPLRQRSGVPQSARVFGSPPKRSIVDAGARGTRGGDLWRTARIPCFSCKLSYAPAVQAGR